jgi:hypothetical protein
MFKDWYREHTEGQNPSTDLITHCKRIMFHAQWNALITPELLKAMEAVIVILCTDQVQPLFFPQFVTDSADYPEKYGPGISSFFEIADNCTRCLIATMWPMGHCPCPQCLVKKCDMQNAGSPKDLQTRELNIWVDNHKYQALIDSALSLVYQEGYTVASNYVDSSCPGRNSSFNLLRL